MRKIKRIATLITIVGLTAALSTDARADGQSGQLSQDLAYDTASSSDIVLGTVLWGDMVHREDTVLWGDTVLRDDTVLWGDMVLQDDTVLWGGSVLWGGTVLWGDTALWDDAVTWSRTVLWGD